MAFFKRSKNKYGNKASKGLDGYNYSSKLEAAIGNLLYAKEKAGEIAIVKRQSQVRLSNADILYKPDWECLDLVSNESFWVEAKGFETPEWRLKLKLWRVYGPGPLHIYYKANSAPEIVIPKGAK